ncbi:MAG TPA: LLM class F420-dependent oxidoreductase [Alphaproteobacteria bacterium]|nr:LLM class F420-dependent oxidoreductase [Alphaproteobacteria bacterium]
MKFGLHSVNLHTCGYPENAMRLARAAEAAGFDSLWVADHVVLPDPPLPQRPMAADMRLLDPVVMLTFYAAHTTRIRLATGVIVLPQRNPLVLAKQLASLDVLSNGRLMFGLGVGWCEPEFQALGVPFEHRGSRGDEYLAAMRAIWTQENPAYQGRYVAFAGVKAQPQPVQRPTPPIIIGGRTTAAFRRAVEHGHGWYGFGLSVEQTAQDIEALQKAAQRYRRPADLGQLEISITPPSYDIEPATVERYAAIGVDRLVLRPQPTLDGPGLEQFVVTTARALGIRAS